MTVMVASSSKGHPEKYPNALSQHQQRDGHLFKIGAVGVAVGIAGGRYDVGTRSCIVDDQRHSQPFFASQLVTIGSLNDRGKIVR